MEQNAGVDWDDSHSVEVAYGNAWDDWTQAYRVERLPDEPVWYWIQRLADLGRGSHERAREIQDPLHEAASEVKRVLARVALLEQMDAIGEACIFGESEGLWQDDDAGYTSKQYLELDNQYRALLPATPQETQ